MEFRRRAVPCVRGARTGRPASKSLRVGHAGTPEPYPNPNPNPDPSHAGIPLTTLGTPESRFSKLDVAIDGADAVDPALNLIKGGGGALFHEKIVEECAEKFIVIVDDSKIVDGLGPSFALPVEIAPFCWEHTMRAIAELPSLKGGKPQLRLGSSANNAVDGDDPAVTDNGLYIIDVFFDAPIADAPKASSAKQSYSQQRTPSLLLTAHLLCSPPPLLSSSSHPLILSPSHSPPLPTPRRLRS